VEFETGLRGDAKLMVAESDTATALGSGTVDVLGSPRLIALCEEACQNAMTGHLEPGTTTVGMRVQFDHLQPTPVGAEVSAEAVLKKIDVAAGKFTRVVVGIDDFMGKCCSPSS
jgi:fluoroacetyl-CoA thioesterase